MEVATYVHKMFTLFKPTPYLQYHLEYKKPATKFPAILRFFLKKYFYQPGFIGQASPWVVVGGG